MAPPAASTSSSSWRNPSAEIQEKYNLVPLPEDFEPTKQEEDLLAMYDTLRAYEKEAARIKEKAAKDKLAAADEKYKQSMEAATAEEPEAAPRKKKARKKKKAAEERPDDHEEDFDMEEEESDEDVMEEDEKSLHERREAKLAEMREKLEEAKQTKEAEAAAAQEALRAELLANKEETGDTGPSLKRKRQEPPTEKSSLIANIVNQATPPHDFSEKLGLKSWKGKVLFPTSSESASWSPPLSATNPNEGAMTLSLDDFDIAQAQIGQGNNTVAIKFTSPPDAKRFSINIAGPNHQDFHDVLFHFNPRERERGGQLVINDKQEGIWGQGVNIPLSTLPLIFGQVACTLVLQVNGDGFDVFLDDMHCARLEHRKQLPSGKCTLYLQFPSTDDYGNPEVWTVYKVWWGNKSIMAKSDLSGVAGVNVFSSLHPRKLFISGLPKISTQAEVDLRRADLERAFRKYGGDHGAIATVPMNTTFAFIELHTERQADLALQEMQDKYRLNRARRSRHEALQEERAAAEAVKQGKTEESNEWD